MSKRGAIWLVFVGATMLGFAFAAGRLSSSRLKVEIPSLNSPAGSQVVTDVAGFEPDIVELGDCDWNTTAPFEVRFVNPGRERVIIDAVKTSCGCTGIDSASYTGVPVEPGSNLVIKGKMEVGSKPGQQRQQVDVLLDSGVVHSAHLRANVIAGYHISAQDVDFGEVDLFHEGAIEPRIVLFRSELRQIAAVQSNVPWVEVGTFQRDDGSVEIVVTARSTNLAYGHQFGGVEIATDDPWAPVARFTVKAAGVSSLRPFPSRLTLSTGSSGRVRFSRLDGMPVELAGIEADEGLACTTDGLSTVHVAAVAPLPKGGTLTVHDKSGHRARVIVAWLGH